MKFKYNQQCLTRFSQTCYASYFGLRLYPRYLSIYTTVQATRKVKWEKQPVRKGCQWGAAVSTTGINTGEGRQTSGKNTCKTLWKSKPTSETNRVTFPPPAHSLKSDGFTSVSLRCFDQCDKMHTREEQTSPVWPVFCSLTDTPTSLKASKETTSSLSVQRNNSLKVSALRARRKNKNHFLLLDLDFAPRGLQQLTSSLRACFRCAAAEVWTDLERLKRSGSDGSGPGKEENTCALCIVRNKQYSSI